MNDPFVLTDSMEAVTVYATRRADVVGTRHEVAWTATAARIIAFWDGAHLHRLDHVATLLPGDTLVVTSTVP